VDRDTDWDSDCDSDWDIEAGDGAVPGTCDNTVVPGDGGTVVDGERVVDWGAVVGGGTTVEAGTVAVVGGADVAPGVRLADVNNPGMDALTMPATSTIAAATSVTRAASADRPIRATIVCPNSDPGHARRDSGHLQSWYGRTAEADRDSMAGQKG
jgi:hypothetical protein